MTFNAMFHLTEGSLAALRSLKGKRWRLATGKPAPEKPGHHFSWDDVIVASDAGESCTYEGGREAAASRDATANRQRAGKRSIV